MKKASQRATTKFVREDETARYDTVRERKKQVKTQFVQEDDMALRQRKEIRRCDPVQEQKIFCTDFFFLLLFYRIV